MDQQKIPSCFFIYFLCCLLLLSCNNGDEQREKIVADPENMDDEIRKGIQNTLEYAGEKNGKIGDTFYIKQFALVNDFYKRNEYAGVWSHNETWNPLMDTMIRFIQNSELYGLFPTHYHLWNLMTLKNTLDSDSLKRMDATLWTKADLLLTDGFMQLVKDMKDGRLAGDNKFKNPKDTLVDFDFYSNALTGLLQKKQFSELVGSMEPKLQGYQDLKKALPRFLDSMDRKVYTYVPYPFKSNDVKDSTFFVRKIQQRLKEVGCIEQDNKLPDSLELVTAIKKYQKKRGIKADGKISATLVRLMNLTDLERFKRIAITLDRYKQLPAVMPEKYILVNLPAYYLKVWDHDTVVLESKIICGKPVTRTPLLYSVISDMVTYPTWTVPASIISKQYLPKLKVNPYYLSTIGLHLVDSKGETIDPGTINWSKYKKGIPYKVMQGSGDDNALGIMKFNFSNPYSVYLHDTNQRYLFKNASRALSHGCVRVQQWQELAFYIARNDSMNLKPGETLRYTTDSIKNWLVQKDKRRIAVKNGIPLYISYFSCEGKNEKIRFYEDIYGEDKLMREKYFK